MHETGMVRDLVKKIVQTVHENGASKAVRVRVWLGALSHMSAGHFKEHFDEEALGTSCEGAQLQCDVSEDYQHRDAQQVILKELEVL